MLPDDVAVTTQTVNFADPPLGVAVLEPNQFTERTVVAAMGFAASMERFELQRYRVLAQTLAARVVVVETPGCGVAGSRMTAAERWALLRASNFELAAARMLAAAAHVDPGVRHGLDPADGQLGFIGYSLGCSLVAAMAHVTRSRTGKGVASLVLVEPVAGRPWSPRALWAATRAEDTLVDAALADNAPVRGAVEPWDRRSDGAPAPHVNRLDMLLLANALRSGRLPDEVAAVGAKQVVVVRGTDSRYRLAGAARAIGRRARAAGSRVTQLEVPGSHGLWHSLPTVEQIGRRIHDTLGDAE